MAEDRHAEVVTSEESFCPAVGKRQLMLVILCIVILLSPAWVGLWILLSIGNGETSLEVPLQPLNFGFPPRCPQVLWCHWGEIEPSSAMLAQDGLVECDQPGKNPLKYSATAGNWTRDTGRTDSEIHSFFRWAIVTWVMERAGERHSFSHWLCWRLGVS